MKPPQPKSVGTSATRKQYHAARFLFCRCSDLTNWPQQYRRTLWAALSRILLQRVACFLLGAKRTSGGPGTTWDRARMALANHADHARFAASYCRAWLHSTIVLAAPAPPPTGIAGLGAPTALKIESGAVVVPEVVARNEGFGRRLTRYEATLGLIA